MTRLRELGHDLLPFEDVRARILEHIRPLPAERRRLQDAAGAVLREEVAATEPLPPFDQSAMDGFAVRSADLARAAETAPLTLRIAGELAAGAAGDAPLPAGRALRIMTGAPVPAGADAVVPHELTTFDRETATFLRPAKPGSNIRPAGGDLRPGDVPLRSGAVLGGPQLAILAALGCTHTLATRRLRVAILSPGNELVAPGAPLGPGQIRNSNAFSLMGLLHGAGAEPIDLGIVRDTKEDVLDAIRRGIEAGADALVSTGGASAGDYDFVQAVVREHGRPGHVFKVAMRPGKPQAFGLFDGRPLFGLPGNPAAAIISFEVFVRPALRALRGETRVLPEIFGVRFPFEHRYKGGRVMLLRARIEPDEPGGFRVLPPGQQDSSYLSSLADANAIVFLPGDQERVALGEVRPAMRIGG